MQGFSYIYKSTKTECGFIGDFSYFVIFFTENETEGKKQACETRQIRAKIGGEEGRADMEMTGALTEKLGKALAEAIESAFTPVRYTIGIEAETDIPSSIVNKFCLG
jgi:hypothetical protein